MDTHLPPPLIAPLLNRNSHSSQTIFVSVSLHMSDRIRFVRFPPEDLEAITAVISRHWSRGIQSSRSYGCSYELKLRGSPWFGSGTGPDAVPALILMRELLAALYAQSWIITTSTDVSRKRDDKDTLIFRRRPLPPPRVQWLVISFKAEDKLRCLGAEPDLLAAISSMLRSLRLLQSEKKKAMEAHHYEFKIHGYPWAAMGEETMQTRLLIIKLMEVLEVHGWRVYASIDQNSGPLGNANYSAVDSWYCFKSVDWTPGDAIFDH
ncbi:hypothetical protein QQS21_002117 [Conoideocrella luteorostrata]|uniref:Uncharacterized protein n=1 Tax=Conoideocrella luteorostrata TaxID=1105319 RepID=A0AAJ0G339_9HYPO|nr:hypothetical protein QQS21_002117 [Conoideocrella luteorostrata]